MWNSIYTLEADAFRLEISPFDWDDETLMELTIRVTSDNFSGCGSYFVVCHEPFASFARDIMALYKTLTGTARLEENFGPDNGFIEFRAGKMGHILVSGTLFNNGRDHTQSLHFENEFDQTYLQPFAKKLFADYKKYQEKYPDRKSALSG